MSNISKCVIITGMSGSGKSTALRILEDRGLFACDNLPPIMIDTLVSVLENNASAIESGVAVVADIRADELLETLPDVMDHLRKNVRDVFLIFLDASDSRLIRRFETTRRRHPLGSGTILSGIERERVRLAPLKEISDIVRDTSSMTPPELRHAILSDLGITDEPISIVVSSFGFKYGVPRDSDYIFDVRFLPNPNYVPELKHLSGKDPEIRDYLSRCPDHETFIEKAADLLKFVLPGLDSAGKKQVHIAVGCTGGRHRSVATAEAIYERLRSSGYRTAIEHRDIQKEG